MRDKCLSLLIMHGEVRCLVYLEGLMMPLTSSTMLKLTTSLDFPATVANPCQELCWLIFLANLQCNFYDSFVLKFDWKYHESFLDRVPNSW